MRPYGWPGRGIAIALLALVGTGCGPLPGSSGSTQAAIAGYHLVHDVPLPGDTSRWDYQTLDPASHRLYIAHLGASEVVVFDTLQQKVIGVVKGVSSVHGLALAPEEGRLFASATGTNELVAIDLESLAVVDRAPAGDYPDGLDYVPAVGKLYVSDEHGSGDTVIDAKTMRPAGSLTLGGDIGNTRYDADAQLVFVAVGSSNELVGLDPKSNRVVSRGPLSGCDGAHGLQLVPSPRRAFVACEGNNRLTVFDFAEKRVVATIGVGGGPDVLAYDPGSERIYVASEDGMLAIIQAGDTIRKLAQGNAGPNAHTIAVDPATHFIYLPLTNVGGRPVLRVLSP